LIHIEFNAGKFAAVSFKVKHREVDNHCSDTHKSIAPTLAQDGDSCLLLSKVQSGAGPLQKLLEWHW
jgi:hypothetical protein